MIFGIAWWKVAAGAALAWWLSRRSSAPKADIAIDWGDVQIAGKTPWPNGSDPTDPLTSGAAP